MQSVTVTIVNKLGLHARPAMTFAETASRFECAVRVRRCDSNDSVDGKSIMEMLMLAGTPGTDLEISADGSDAGEALKELQELVARRFDEDE